MDTLILSQDGSHTILSDKFGVSYHSKYGALQETRTVFLEAGLQYALANNKQSISILEMGFGTGLNAIMTFMEFPSDKKLTYHTLEAYPITIDQAKSLNYPTVLEMGTSHEKAFMNMHTAKNNEKLELSENVAFQKYIQKIEEFNTEMKYDVIYYDAFAPSSQEELWTEDMMQKMHDICHPGASLVTYCAKGSFKRALKKAGFAVEGLPGPIGKREMTRAFKVQ